MLLSEALEIHDQFSRHESSLPRSLGDGFLLAHNRVYSNIRRLSLKFEFRYTSRRFKHHHVHPFMHLHEIQKYKTIPYVDNVSVLKVIARRCKPTGPLAWDHPGLAIKPNFLFHEACHAVANVITAPYFNEAPDSDERVFRLLLEESFASSAEKALFFFARTPIHRQFLHHASYVSRERDRALDISGMAKWPRSLKKNEIFSFLVLSHLCANYLQTDPSEMIFRRICRVTFGQRKPFSGAEKKFLFGLYRGALTMDWSFRTTTAGLYFRMLGIHADDPKIYAFDFIGAFEKEKRFMRCLKLLGQAALRRPQS